MFILIFDRTVTTERPATLLHTIERRAPAKADTVRAIVLRELDQILPCNWNRELTCDMFIVQPYDSITPISKLYELDSHYWPNRNRKRFHIRAYISKQTA
jgi:hypothetical protein